MGASRRILFKETSGFSWQGRPACRSVLVDRFSCRFPLLHSLVISIAVSLTCHRSVSPAVAPEKSKRQAESFLRPLKAR